MQSDLIVTTHDLASEGGVHINTLLVHPGTSFHFVFFHHASLPYNPAQVGVTLLASPYRPESYRPEIKSSERSGDEGGRKHFSMRGGSAFFFAAPLPTNPHSSPQVSNRDEVRMKIH